MAKKKNSSNRSLTLVIIVMAIICVFVGYLVGLNLLKWMRGGTDQVAQTENSAQTEQSTQQESTSQVPEEEETAETKQVEEDTSSKSSREPETATTNNEDVFKIQVGAFSNKANAVSFKNELEEQGYNVIIKEAATFKVRVIGRQSREETEKIEEELIDLGYDTFIVK